MHISRLNQCWRPLLFLCSILALGALAGEPARQSPTRKDGEDVNRPGFRELSGLRPDQGLLFNGWGISPAGDQVATSDMPLKLVVSPDKRLLAAACAGFNNTGLALFDLSTRKVSQFFPLKKIWNGLAFSPDSSRIYVSGGDSGKIHLFKLDAGQATPADDVAPSPAADPVFLAAIAVHPKTGKLLVVKVECRRSRR